MVRIFSIYITFSNNNVHILVRDSKKVLFKKTCGFFVKGSLRSNETIVEQLVVDVCLFIKKNNYVNVILFLKGLGTYRFVVFKVMQKITFIRFLRVYQVSNRVFNGCRKRKKRRLLFIKIKGKCSSLV